MQTINWTGCSQVTAFCGLSEGITAEACLQLTSVLVQRIWWMRDGSTFRRRETPEAHPVALQPAIAAPLRVYFETSAALRTECVGGAAGSDGAILARKRLGSRRANYSLAAGRILNRANSAVIGPSPLILSLIGRGEEWRRDSSLRRL